MKDAQNTTAQIVNHSERNLLAIMIYSPPTLNNILSKVRKQDFLSYQHQTIFATICQLVNQNKNVNITTILGFLTEDKVIDKIGGIQYITDVAEEYIDDENVENYIKNVVQASRARQLRKVIQNIDLELKEQKEIESILFKAEEMLMELRSTSNHQDFVKIADITQNVINKVETMANRDTVYTGIPSGFPTLDNKTLGFQAGDLIILAARPSMGKTAFALNMIKNMTFEHDNYAAAFISLEMPAEHLLERILGSTAMIESQLIRTGKGLSGSNWKSLAVAADRLKASRTFIYDSPNMTLQQIQSQVRQLCRKEHIDILIIDYLQLLSIGNQRFSSRQEEISNISRHLKLLARELKIPVICLSQLSRSVERRENKRPIMSDLRDSGAIEQDADLVMFLYRDDYYRMNEPDFNPLNTAELIISKHRNGPTGILNFSFAEQYGVFEENK